MNEKKAYRFFDYEQCFAHYTKRIMNTRQAKIRSEPQKGITPSKHWLKENISFAYLDDDLWLLLQNKVWRMKLLDYIVNHKLTDNSRFGKMVAEGLGAIAALILAA